jgi:hypothetical protein
MEWAQLQTFASGVLATVLAALQICGWLALGSFFLRNPGPVSVSLPLALLIGSAITAFLAALLCAAGRVEGAIAVSAGLSLLAVWLRRDWVRHRLRELYAAYAAVWADRRWLRAAVVASVLVSWLLSIVPPRDADVMRYHLAHIRQIVTDGGWQPIVDYSYALPFGWSLGFLPFEYAGLPEGAHLLNWGVWLVTLGGLLEIALRTAGRWHAPALLLCAVFAFQPMVLKGATTAHADSYSILQALAVTALLLRLPGSARDFGLFGFAAWIGMQGRYQAAAIGLAAGAVLLLWLGQRRLALPALASACLGGICALALSAPFYVANWLAFENPVWPLFAESLGSQASYADQVAARGNLDFTGSRELATVLVGLKGLFLSPNPFPVPHLTAAMLLAALRWRSREALTITVFSGAFLAIWMATNPNLYPRYILTLFPAVIAGCCAVLASLAGAARPWLRRAVTGGLGLCVAGLVAICTAYSLDSFHFLLTGDARRYHEYTWYWDVFEWIERSTPADARFLVFANSGTTYYLDRPYRRADPCSSGVIDWRSIESEHDLLDRLRADGYTHLFYDERDWSNCPAGAQMSAVIESARRSGRLETLASFDLRLGTLRLLRQSIPATVSILAPRPEGARETNGP